MEHVGLKNNDIKELISHFFKVCKIKKTLIIIPPTVDHLKWGLNYDLQL